MSREPASGFVGYVLRLEVEQPYVERYEVQRVGGEGIDELWVPAEELESSTAASRARSKWWRNTSSRPAQRVSCSSPLVARGSAAAELR
jgi:hypothetical protein